MNAATAVSSPSATVSTLSSARLVTQPLSPSARCRDCRGTKANPLYSSHDAQPFAYDHRSLSLSHAEKIRERREECKSEKIGGWPGERCTITPSADVMWEEGYLPQTGTVLQLEHGAFKLGVKCPGVQAYAPLFVPVVL